MTRDGRHPAARGQARAGPRGHEPARGAGPCGAAAWPPRRPHPRAAALCPGALIPLFL